MLAVDRHLAHSLLSPYLNLGLLLPGEVCDAVEEAYRAGRVPIQSAEGFVRQVIGWREYVWGLYWLWPDHAEANVQDNRRAIPPAWTGEAPTEMRCLATTLASLDARAWVHHIPRLMILSGFANLYGIHPRRLMEWMSDYCGDCRFAPARRVGEDACPFTTLYWDFIARHREALGDNARMGRAVANLDRLGDVDQVRSHAAGLVRRLREGRV